MYNTTDNARSTVSTRNIFGYEPSIVPLCLLIGAILMCCFSHIRVLTCIVLYKQWSYVLLMQGLLTTPFVIAICLGAFCNLNESRVAPIEFIGACAFYCFVCFFYSFYFSSHRHNNSVDNLLLVSVAFSIIVYIYISFVTYPLEI